MAEKTRRTRDYWTGIALRALAEGGLAAVAIEPLAARAGATKGSVYWHFPNREALLAATLQRWEREHTEAVITQVEVHAEPVERLRALLTTAIDAEQVQLAELALLASADDPLVAEAVGRGTERRLGYLASVFEQAGFAQDAARRRALLAYSVYLGQAQLMRGARAAVPDTADERRAYLDDTLRSLTLLPERAR